MIDKKGFIIIFHRYFFYVIAVILVVALIYGYFDDKGYIKEGTGAYNVGKTFGLQPPNASLVEQQIFALVNKERTKNGLSKLSWDNKLSMIAREHSKDMYERDFFDHVNPDGDDPTDRAKSKGIPITNGNWIGIAENIAQTPIGNVEGCGSVSSEKDISQCAMDGWMSSSGHRANILDENYDVIGVGIYCTTSMCWDTQDFR